MAVRAYIDESQPGGTGSGQPYYLAASVLLDDAEADDYRETMLLTRPTHLKKQRWSDAEDHHRTRVIECIGAMHLMHVIAVNLETAGKPDERVRRECFSSLIYELDRLGVETAVFECRSTAQDQRDRAMLDAMRSSRLVPSAFRIEHSQGRDEPLLWIPDAVAGVASSGDEVNSALIASNTIMIPTIYR